MSVTITITPYGDSENTLNPNLSSQVQPLQVPTNWRYHLFSAPPGTSESQYLFARVGLAFGGDNLPLYLLPLNRSEMETLGYKSQFTFESSDSNGFMRMKCFCRGLDDACGKITYSSSENSDSQVLWCFDTLTPSGDSGKIGIYPREGGANLPDSDFEMLCMFYDEARQSVIRGNKEVQYDQSGFTAELSDYAPLSTRVWKLERRGYMGSDPGDCLVQSLAIPAFDFAIASIWKTKYHFFLCPKDHSSTSPGQLAMELRTVSLNTANDTWQIDDAIYNCPLSAISLAGNREGIFSFGPAGSVFAYLTTLDLVFVLSTDTVKYSGIYSHPSDYYCYGIRKSDHTVWKYFPERLNLDVSDRWFPLGNYTGTDSDFKAASLAIGVTQLDGDWVSAPFAISHQDCPLTYGPRGAVYSLDDTGPTLISSNQLQIHRLVVAANFLIGLAPGKKMYIYNGTPGSWTDITTPALRPWGGVQDVLDGGNLGLVVLSGDQRELVRLVPSERRFVSLWRLPEQYRKANGTLKLYALDGNSIFATFNGQFLVIRVPS